MVHFVGAGPGAPDLITLRGAELLRRADMVIYAGSLVNPALLGLCPPGCAVYNSAEMTLEQVLEVMQTGENVVRLHTGDPCLYGAVREQMDALDRLGIPYDLTPGVSSFCGAAAALGAEYTMPDVSRADVGPGTGIHFRPGRSWGQHGDFSVRRYAGTLAGGAAPGGLHPGHPGGPGL